MKRVIVTFAGGRLAAGLCRALKASPEPFYIIGVDAHKFQLHRARVDEKHLVPRAKDDDYIPVLRSIIEDAGADLLWVNHESEIAVITKRAHALGIATFLPSHKTVALCQDKMASYRRFKDSGIPVPESLLILDEADLSHAFRQMGNNLWLRAIKGTGGKGSLPVSDFDAAKKWIDFHHGWGHFMAAQRLTEQTVTWESIWNRGKLVAAQGRQRLYWEFPSLTPSGVTGIGGAHRWVADPLVDRTALQAIKATDQEPHGIFSVDMTYDWQGLPMVTEINCGRFMSGGIIYHVTSEHNLAHIAVRVALGEMPPLASPLLNPLPQDVVLVHGMDMEPVLMDMKEVDHCLETLERRRAKSHAYASDAPGPISRA